MELCKCDNFIVYSNNPQFIEAMELFVGEENLEVYLLLDYREVEIDIQTAYDYLGEIYNIINSMRFQNEILELPINFKQLNDDINEYESKYFKIINGEL